MGFAFFINRSVICARRVWESSRDRIARSGLRITRTIICGIRIGSMPMSLTISVSPPSGVFRSVGQRWCPLFVRPRMARDIFDLWTTVSLRRFESNRWELARNANPTLRFLRSAVARNADRSRRRWLRASVAPITETQCPISQEDGTAHQMPSGDEMIPDVPHCTLPLSPPLGIVGSGAGSPRGKNNNATMSNVQTPERSMGYLGCPVPT